jgi:hypothetical protein
MTWTDADARQSQLEALERWHQRAISHGMTEAEWAARLDEAQREHPDWPASWHGESACPLQFRGLTEEDYRELARFIRQTHARSAAKRERERQEAEAGQRDDDDGPRD